MIIWHPQKGQQSSFASSPDHFGVNSGFFCFGPENFGVFAISGPMTQPWCREALACRVTRKGGRITAQGRRSEQAGQVEPATHRVALATAPKRGPAWWPRFAVSYAWKLQRLVAPWDAKQGLRALQALHINCARSCLATIIFSATQGMAFEPRSQAAAPCTTLLM